MTFQYMVPIHYLAKVHIFIEKMALNHGFAHNLSKFYLKNHLLESKSCVN